MTPVDVERLVRFAGVDETLVDGIRALAAERDAAVQEERLCKKFHDLTVKERDLERLKCNRLVAESAALKAEVERLRGRVNKMEHIVEGFLSQAKFDDPQGLDCECEFCTEARAALAGEGATETPADKQPPGRST